MDCMAARKLKIETNVLHDYWLNFFSVSHIYYRAGDKIKKNEMGWACGAYG